MSQGLGYRVDYVPGVGYVRVETRVERRVVSLVAGPVRRSSWNVSMPPRKGRSVALDESRGQNVRGTSARSRAANAPKSA